MYNVIMNFLYSADPLILATIVLGVITVILIIAIARMHNKMKRFLVSFDSENVGDSLEDLSERLKDLQQFRKELEAYLAGVEKRLRKSIRAVHTVRFNPFKGTGDGGDQSFATTLLSEEGDGVIISSLYSRERSSVFAKPVRTNTSEHELSDEERESLENALKKLGM